MNRSFCGAVAPPAWFSDALKVRPEHREIAVGQTRISYRVWGAEDRPGVVLVHGGAAHSGWWDHIAPLLHSYRVVAVDLSGHGDSGRRSEYSIGSWADEVVAVAAAEDLHRTLVIGHSLGGWVAVAVGVEHPDVVAGVALIDSPLNDAPPETVHARRRQPTRLYPTVEAAVERFATLPPQKVLLPHVREHIARTSLRPVDGGWTWKFDPAFSRPRPPLRDLLERLQSPGALFRCEHGLVTHAMAMHMTSLVSQGLVVIDLPDAGHHPMLDQPLALISGLRSLLAVWPPQTSSSDEGPQL